MRFESVAMNVLSANQQLVSSAYHLLPKRQFSPLKKKAHDVSMLTESESMSDAAIIPLSTMNLCR